MVGVCPAVTRLAIYAHGELQTGIDLQEGEMRSLHETGSVLHTTRFRLHLAESVLMLRDLKRARSHLDAGLKHVESHGEFYLAQNYIASRRYCSTLKARRARFGRTPLRRDWNLRAVRGRIYSNCASPWSSARA
jgi:hypothetical protein